MSNFILAALPSPSRSGNTMSDLLNVYLFRATFFPLVHNFYVHVCKMAVRH